MVGLLMASLVLISRLAFLRLYLILIILLSLLVIFNRAYLITLKIRLNLLRILSNK